MASRSCRESSTFSRRRGARVDPQGIAPSTRRSRRSPSSDVLTALRVSASLAVGLVLGIGVFGGGVVQAATTSAPSVARGTPLTDTTLGPGTEIIAVDEISPALGYAVAYPTDRGRGSFFLVRTTNLGTNWTVQSALPLGSFRGPYGVGAVPMIQFVTPKIGYAWVQNGKLWVTTDVGATWSQLSRLGIQPSFVISGATMFVTSDDCKGTIPSNGPAQCPSTLTQFRVGMTRPMHTATIPELGAPEGRAATVLVALSSSRLIVAEGVGGRTSLLETMNAGASWKLLNNPCHATDATQLLTLSTDQWLLYCFTGGGMTQGTSELWVSHNGSGSWSLVALANQSGRDMGHIRDVFATFSVSGNGRILFGALGGAGGGLEYSTDGGRSWTSANLSTAVFGGAPEYVSTFGATGAILDVQGGAQFRTINGLSWHKLAPLPAGRYHGDAICTRAQGTVAALGRPTPSPTVSGATPNPLNVSLRYPVVFTNRSDVACYLNGIPSVQPNAGPSHSLVGPASTQTAGNYPGAFVILRAHGGVANVSVVIERASDLTQHCTVRTARGFVVRFSPPSTFQVALRARALCANASTVSVNGVAAGV